MAENVQQSIEVPVGLSLFGGLVTEMSPSDLPEGISPDCQDVVFLPGSIASRPAVHRVGYAFPANVTITYQKTFNRPDGIQMNLFLTSDGQLWVENASQNPFVTTKIGQVTPGSYCNSLTAFGREYLAFHNGVTGTDIPRQFDGTFFDRVTQDGPGQSADLANVIIPASNLKSYAFGSGAFVVIPVQGGGSVAIGTGSAANGGAITLPVGYIFTNTVSWATVQNGWNRATEVAGVFAASAAGGVTSASFESRTGASIIPSTVNWAIAAWTSNATVTIVTVAGVEYVSFTTSNGDNLCVCGGVLTTANPALTVPSGFSSSNFAYVVGPESTDTFANGMQGVLACSLSGGLSKTLTYQDGSSNQWTGSVSVFGLFWVPGGGVTSSSITGGNAITIMTTGGATVCIMYGSSLASGSSFGLPAGISLISSTCSMCGYTLSGQTFVAHGWPFCQMTGQLFLGSYQDGQGNSWPGSANFFALGISNAVPGVSLSRSQNTVQGQTLTPHGLQVGYLVQISDVAASVVGGGIVSIVINNENTPGIATVTTNSPHGLLPGNNVNITGVPPTSVGGGISSIVREGDIVTVTTAAVHGLLPNGVVTVAGVSDISFDGTFVISEITSTTTFTYVQVDVDAVSSGGTISLQWPIPDNTPTPTFFQVQSSPTPTTFQIQIFYTDGTWTGGTITFDWNGQFYVTAVLDPYTFQYQQYGPNTSTSSTGVVTPYGQAAPGLRNCVVIFETRQGFITAPSSPTLNFITNGGQYIEASNVPIGPGNIIRRILAFTGANGANYFYIPVPAQVNGVIVSTSTTIEDNTTTSVLLDFSDNTLFDSTAIDIPGFDLFNMGVIGPCLSPFNYASRLAWWGLDNDIQNLVNLGFDGGYASGDLTTPLGWDVHTPGGILVTTGDSGFAWQITGDGSGNNRGQIQQSAFRDWEGISILQVGHQYRINLWAKINAPVVAGAIEIQISSLSLGYTSTAIIPASDLTVVGAFFEATFSSETPPFLPSDLTISLYTVGTPNGFVVTIDETQIVDGQSPTSLNFLFSYVGLPEQLDLVTGQLGAADDDTFLQNAFTYRDGMRFLTSRGLHETQDSDNTEPSGWAVRQVTNNCGACGPRACASGENFSVWVTSASTFPPVGRGMYVYTGGEVYKLSQEIQPDFDLINPQFASSIWVEVDSIIRRIYIGVPTNGASAPDLIYVLDYRELDTAGDLASHGPIHISYTGKMICSDLSRKWTRWNLSMNCGKMMFISGVGTTMALGTGNGVAPNLIPGGFSSVYWLDPTKLTDDDYGQIVPYYTTYFFINHEAEQALQVGLHRKLFKRYSMNVTGVGQVQITPYADNLQNPWPTPPPWPLGVTCPFDIGDGLNVSTERCAFKIQSIPLVTQTDNSFNLTKLVITLMQEPVSPIRFGAV